MAKSMAKAQFTLALLAPKDDEDFEPGKGKKDEPPQFSTIGRKGAGEPLERPSVSQHSLSRRGFEAFYRQYRKAAVEDARSKSGYSVAEVSHFRHVFDSYDADKSNSVERSELSKMIAEYFPDATKSKKGQRDIQ